MTEPAVSLVVCGAPLTSRTPDLAASLITSGYQVSVIATPAASDWLDADAVEAVTGAAPRLAFRAPGSAKSDVDPMAMVVCPATFNTVNKVAAGAADSYALSSICSAMGARLPLVVAPMVNNKLWGHPAWSTSLDVLRSVGATFVDLHTGDHRPVAVESGTGPQVVERFDPRWLATAVAAALNR
ncbi:flavoprotein [Virgisporangium aurantiacum]|uniref:Flavoprotein n=1 Tax=Virgisporangium aurantiacum TaxID=175570 RepID=A0A8J3Z076_9ACTN|nr:flavoprotein [Virgisporangium aurantiacum]GIJ53913.1 flavoprotein [Virgisporangium aurantiacum]